MAYVAPRLPNSQEFEKQITEIIKPGAKDRKAMKFETKAFIKAETLQDTISVITPMTNKGTATTGTTT